MNESIIVGNIKIELAKMIADAWLGAEFEGGRHLDRVNMLE